MTLPQVLYKYVTPSGFGLLESLSLRFTPPANLNDPFESRFPVLRHFSKPSRHATISPDDQLQSQPQDWQHGLTCFSEIPTDLLMWAHYADSHGGLVIGFDTNHQVFSTLGRLFPVKYRLRRPRLSSAVANDDAFVHLGVKSRDWKYEREWRLVTDLSSCSLDSEGAYVRRFPADMVRVVILGLRHSPTLRLRTIEWAQCHPTATIQRARLDSLRFRLHLDDNLEDEPLIVMTEHGPKDPILSVPCDPNVFSVRDLEFRNGTLILRDLTPTLVPARRRRTGKRHRRT